LAAFEFLLDIGVALLHGGATTHVLCRLLFLFCLLARRFQSTSVAGRRGGATKIGLPASFLLLPQLPLLKGFVGPTPGPHDNAQKRRVCRFFLSETPAALTTLHGGRRLTATWQLLLLLGVFCRRRFFCVSWGVAAVGRRRVPLASRFWRHSVVFVSVSCLCRFVHRAGLSPKAGHDVAWAPVKDGRTLHLLSEIVILLLLLLQILRGRLLLLQLPVLHVER